jgi:TolB protein
VYQVQLTKEGDNLYPSWSSDGRQIIFSSNRVGNWDVWIMNGDGTNQTQLTKASGDNIKPRLSPDGKRIVWLSNRLGYWGIWTMNADGSIPYEMVRSVADDADPCWSPDGKNILFHTRWINDHGTLSFMEKGLPKTIFMMSTLGINLTAISTYPGANMGLSNEMQTVWSPDAGKIAFVSDRSGNLDIWIINFKGFEAPPTAY